MCVCVCVGDTIHFVDNHRINVDNIDTVLARLSGKASYELAIVSNTLLCSCAG